MRASVKGPNYVLKQAFIGALALVLWFCYLVDHGYDGDGEVDLQAVDDGHPKAAQDGEHKAPFLTPDSHWNRYRFKKCLDENYEQF